MHSAHCHSPTGGFGHEFSPKYTLGVYVLPMACYAKVSLKGLGFFLNYLKDYQPFGFMCA